MSADKRIPDIPKDVIDSIARAILPSIRKYYESEEGQREYAAWLEKKIMDGGIKE